ncbi:hypothetical protein AX16_006527 [Volvariella volvacea WC 439]|nr:hypothetical protein AX16_006527 [Volvariella volvacea WC 439]
MSLRGTVLSSLHARSPPSYSSIGRRGGDSGGSGANPSNGQLITTGERQMILYQQQQQNQPQYWDQHLPRNVGHWSRNRGRKIVYMILIALLMSWIVYCHFYDITNPAVRDRIRREWEREVQNHQDEVDGMNKDSENMRRLREDWVKERQEWAMERQRHEEENREWQRRIDEILRKEKEWEEIEERKNALHWEELKPDDHCSQYGTRRYTATLPVPSDWDGHRYCLMTPIKILGINYTKPLQCEEVGRGRWRGYWDAHEPDCSTYFEDYHDKGCTGPRSGFHRYEAHMGNLLGGDDWRTMCSTTPAYLMGREYPSPHHCANWGIHGIWGIWFIEDSEC